jgi:hypothetical protein
MYLQLVGLVFFNLEPRVFSVNLVHIQIRQLQLHVVCVLLEKHPLLVPVLVIIVLQVDMHQIQVPVAVNFAYGMYIHQLDKQHVLHVQSVRNQSLVPLMLVTVIVHLDNIEMVQIAIIVPLAHIHLRKLVLPHVIYVGLIIIKI